MTSPKTYSSTPNSTHLTKIATPTSTQTSLGQPGASCRTILSSSPKPLDFSSNEQKRPYTKLLELNAGDFRDMFWPADDGRVSFGGLNRAVPTHSDATSTAIMTGNTATPRNGLGNTSAVSQSNSASGGNPGGISQSNATSGGTPGAVSQSDLTTSGGTPDAVSQSDLTTSDGNPSGISQSNATSDGN